MASHRAFKTRVDRSADPRAPPKPRRRSPRLTNPLRARHPGCARLRKPCPPGHTAARTEQKGGQLTLAAKIRVHSNPPKSSVSPTKTTSTWLSTSASGSRPTRRASKRRRPTVSAARPSVRVWSEISSPKSRLRPRSPPRRRPTRPTKAPLALRTLSPPPRWWLRPSKPPTPRPRLRQRWRPLRPSPSPRRPRGRRGGPDAGPPRLRLSRARLSLARPPLFPPTGPSCVPAGRRCRPAPLRPEKRPRPVRPRPRRRLPPRPWPRAPQPPVPRPRPVPGPDAGPAGPPVSSSGKPITAAAAPVDERQADPATPRHGWSCCGPTRGTRWSRGPRSPIRCPRCGPPRSPPSRWWPPRLGSRRRCRPRSARWWTWRWTRWWPWRPSRWSRWSSTPASQGPSPSQP